MAFEFGFDVVRIDVDELETELDEPREFVIEALAGDVAARRGERGLLASDLFNYLPTCVNPAQRS